MSGSPCAVRPSRALLCLGLALLSVWQYGCVLLPREVRGICIDRRSDQPLDANGQAASPARVGERIHGVESHKFLEWPSGNGSWADSRDVTCRSTSHLERTGAERRELTIDPFNVDLVARSPLGLVLSVHSAIEPIWTIVSLTPLILVETPGTIQYLLHVYATPDDSTRQPGEMTKASVFLNGGFHYGLQVPYTATPRWTSPEAGERIYKAREVSPTEQMIDHPTRPLRLVRDGDVWRVELAN